MTNYSKTMAEALAEVHKIVEATMKDSQIAQLKKAYEPMRGKKISTGNAQKLSKMMDKFDDNKQLMIQLVKADIPFVSSLAVTRLISKHNMKGAEINKLKKEEVEFWESLEEHKGDKSHKHPHDEDELDEAVKEYDVKIKVGSKTNSYNIMSTDELSAAQSVLHSIMARSRTGGSPGLAAVRKSFPDMKSLNKKGVSVSIKEESELDETKYKVSVEGMPPVYMDAKSVGEIKTSLRKLLKNPDMINDIERVTDAIIKKDLRGRIAGKDDKDDEEEVKKEEVELDEQKFDVKTAETKKGKITVNSFANLEAAKKYLEYMQKRGHKGIISQGGRTIKEEVEIDENKLPDMREALRQVRTEKPIQLDEEVELDEGKFERDMVTAKGISLQIRIIVTARNMIDDGKSDSEIMKTTKLSAGDVKKLRQDMSDRPGEYDEEAELEEGKMKELHGYIAQGKSAEWIAKKMKVDVEAIKTLMAGYNESYEIGTNEYRDYLEKLTPGEGTQEASAQADAMRAMRRGKKEVDPADIDTDASPEDRAAADKNIIMQLRGVVSLKGVGKMILTPQQARNLKKKDSKYLKTLGSGFVEFEKGHEKVDLKVAQAILNKFNSLKKPADKAKFQAKVAKSYKDMLKALKEEIELDEALPSHLKKFFDKDGNPKSKEGKAAWERLAKMKGFKKYTSKQVKMAIGIAFDKRYVQGNMTGAVNAIEKIAKGLSEIEPVRNALRRANENTILDRIDRKLKERKELHEASNRWELGGKKFSLVNDKGTWILVTQGTGTEKKLKARTQQQATAELVKKGYRES